MPKPSPLNRAQAHNALRQIESDLSPAVKNLAKQLLGMLEDDGSASVKTVHDALFPLAETVNASAQLSTLAKKVEESAQKKGLGLKLGFSGSKKGGVATRRLFFAAPRALPVADTEGLDRIPPAQRITGQLATLLDEQPRIVLLTYNQNEFDAVRKTFWRGATAPPTLGTGTEIVDDLGELCDWRVLHAHSRQGNRESQRSADTLRRAHYPQAIVSVGIAFGINDKKQAIGDVLVSKFIVDYEAGRVSPTGIELRGPRPPAARALVIGLEQLNTRRQSSVGWPRLHFGGVLSGEKLVDDCDYRDSLSVLASQGDLVGGEMEAAGLFTALDDTQTAWVVIKAICDFADGNKNNKTKEADQKHAAANAAEVVHALLSSAHYPCPKKQADNSNPKKRPKPSFIADPLQHRVAGQWADAVSLENIREADERQNAPKVVAFEHLLQWLADDSSPPLYALLGEYGMGKTTHCQTLTRHLEEQREAGLPVRAPLYFDLRKVERIAAAQIGGAGQVATLEETIQDCLRNGYLQTSGQALTYQDVLDVIDEGALVIFDGLDEVLSRITDSQGLRFTANLLKVLPEARARQKAAGLADQPQRLPKVLLSCRTQFFRNLAEQNSHLTGEHRGGQDASQYRASVLSPFTDEQIRTYLQSVLPGQDVDALMALVADVHNLRELAGRPFTLKLVAQFVPRIQSWQQQGKTITGASLYREVAREWLIRDKEKQSFQPEQKEKLAGDLAAHLWRTGQRGLRAIELEGWLDAWLGQLPPHAGVLQKPRDLLYQDLRNATFLKRTDAEKPENSRFEFAHTSLQEFFLADYLFRALQQPSRPNWAMPKPSDETLDFLGQILAETGPQSAELQVLSSWRTPYLPLASELQLAYAVRAWQRGWPQPVTAGSDLHGADLSDWHFGTLIEPGVRPEKVGEFLPLFDLSGCNFSKTQLRRARFWRVRLDNADFSGAALSQAEVLGCSRVGGDWRGVEDGGLVVRPGGEKTIPVEWPLSLYLAQGHGDVVTCCAFSPDGQQVLSGSDDKTLKLWDVQTGQCLRSFTGHEGLVYSCACSPDGHQVLSGSDDHSLKLWDVQSGQCLRSFTGHKGSVQSCAFSPDGQQVLSGSDDKTLKLWDVQTGQCLRSFTGHKGSVQSCAFSPDGQQVLSGSDDKTLKLWDVQTGQCLRSFTGHEDGGQSCAFSPDGQRVLSDSFYQSLKLWDVQTGQCLRSFTGHEDWVQSCAFSPDGQQVLSGSDDHSLKLWDVQSGQCLRSFTGHKGSVQSCAFSPDGQQVLSGSDDKTLKLWDVQTGQCLRSFTWHEGLVYSCACSPDGQQVLSCSFDQNLKLWDVQTGQCLCSFTGHKDGVQSCAFSPDGQQVLSGSFDQSLKLWDVQTGQCLRSFSGHEGWLLSCAFSPDGQQVLSGSADNSLKLWDVQTGQCLRSFTGHEDWVRSCAFSPDGQRVLSGSFDKGLKLWDVQTAQCLCSFTGHEDGVQSCAFSPDGQQVLSGSFDQSLKLWDVQTAQCLRSFTGHEGSVQSCAFSPDGQQALSGSADNILKLWDVKTGQCLRSFTGHEDWVQFCAFSPDGQQVFSGSHDSTLKLWNTQTGECLRTYLDIPDGAAAWDNTTNELLYASGRAWRSLRWQGHDESGNTVVYPLESKPDVKLLPWTLD